MDRTEREMDHFYKERCTKQWQFLLYCTQGRCVIASQDNIAITKSVCRCLLPQTSESRHFKVNVSSKVMKVWGHWIEENQSPKMFVVVEDRREILKWNKLKEKILAYPSLYQDHCFSLSLCHFPVQKCLGATGWALETGMNRTKHESLLNKIKSFS